MGKKDKLRKKEPESLPTEGISSVGKKVISGGVATLIIGFIVLSMTDPMGRNWASFLSPFLILGGYAMIGIGIFLPEKLPSAKVSESSFPQPPH